MEPEEEEEWRPIEGFPGYEVSSLGRVGSWKPARQRGGKIPTERYILKQFLHSGKVYRQVNIRPGTGFKTKLVHLLVCEAFHGPRPAKHQIRHRNGKGWDNRASNLCWGTPVQNAADKLKHGTHIHGEKHSQARLSAEDVNDIRGSTETAKALAARYGMSPSHIYDIRAHKRWAYL